MSVQSAYKRDAKNIRKLGSAVIRLATYQGLYACYSALEVAEPPGNMLSRINAERDKAREGMREALAESKKLLEGLVTNYPI